MDWSAGGHDLKREGIKRGDIWSTGCPGGFWPIIEACPVTSVTPSSSEGDTLRRGQAAGSASLSLMMFTSNQHLSWDLHRPKMERVNSLGRTYSMTRFNPPYFEVTQEVMVKKLFFRGTHHSFRGNVSSTRRRGSAVPGFRVK